VEDAFNNVADEHLARGADEAELYASSASCLCSWRPNAAARRPHSPDLPVERGDSLTMKSAEKKSAENRMKAGLASHRRLT
jgi:hypothetical protein